MTESALLYSATMSLDGYIAGPGGDMSWLTPYFAPNPPLEGLTSRIGALLIGRTTYGGDDPNRGTDAEGAFGGTWHGPQVVLTHHPDATAPDDVSFATDLDTAVAQAKTAAAGKYVCILGADVARQCLEAGVLDEILIGIVPVLLGSGTPLFRLPGSAPVRLERMSLSDAGFETNLWYRVRYGA